MKAMILAAGFGTRLAPYTQKAPKALVQLAGQPLLALILQRLIAAGCDRIAINVHHFADQVADWLAAHEHPGIDILISVEEEILGTGGGIERMVPLLGTDEPILVHNVDVLSNLPLRELVRAHREQHNRATLAVSSRQTRRHLLFDEAAQLCGRAGSDNQEPQFVRKPEGGLQLLAFNGIQVIDPLLFQEHEEPRFSSVDLYLEAAARGEKVSGWRMDAWYWRDLGKPYDLEAAEKDVAEKIISLS